MVWLEVTMAGSTASQKKETSSTSSLPEELTVRGIMDKWLEPLRKKKKLKPPSPVRRGRGRGLARRRIEKRDPSSMW